MAAIAQATETIRIGSAGIMLPHYSPYKVAEQFRVLDAIAPGRIDLGLGRAPGSDGKTAMALNSYGHQAAEHFSDNVRDLIAWVTNEPLVRGHPYASLKANPIAKTKPEVWMLGTSDYGALVAARLGLPYCFAHFITDGAGTRRALAIYRENFQPSKNCPQPLPSICVWALAADSDQEARHLFMPRAYWKLMRNQGGPAPLITPEEAAKYPYPESDKAFIDNLSDHALVGSATRVADRLRHLAQTKMVDEIVVLTWAHGQADRRRSYKLLARELIQ